MPTESVRDLKFVDDEALMVAVSNECECFGSIISNIG